jgi:uncharacterized protein (DUF305 family)
MRRDHLEPRVLYPWAAIRMLPKRIAALALIVSAGAACRTGPVDSRPQINPRPPVDPRTPIVQPGAPGEPSRIITAEQAADLSQVDYIGADIKFMQGMISHHAQAVEMVAFIPTHTTREGLRLLGRRIDISQRDEIRMMEQWLASRGQQVPGADARHVHGAALMPGMLTDEEMSDLARARGAEFDRLFLEGMIKHHEGALTMVRELFATPGAGQDVAVFSFASDVEADQRMEVERMGAMLDAILEEMKK